MVPTYYEQHKEIQKQRQREFYWKNRERVLNRQKKYKHDDPDRYREYSKKYYRNNREKISYRSLKHRKACEKKFRELIKEQLGVKCSNPKCLVPGGCEEPKCLQMDHINGDGHKWAKRGGRIPMTLYFLKYPDRIKKELQLLCANCNWIKNVDNNEAYWKKKEIT